VEGEGLREERIGREDGEEEAGRLKDGRIIRPMDGPETERRPERDRGQSES
jgi:hypothetical protein